MSAKDDPRFLSRDFLKGFLELYRQEACLWQINHKSYMDRKERAKSYKKLMDKMREIDPNVSEKDVRRKLNVIRTSYRQLVTKVNESIAAGDDPVFKPKLWYFKLLDFLQDQKLPCYSKDYVKKKNRRELMAARTDETDLFDCNAIETNDTEETPKPQRRPPTNTKQKLHALKEDILEKLSTVVERCVEDECDLVGKNIAMKLKKLSPDMRVYAEKLVHDVLFEAQLGTLSRGSYIEIPCITNGTEIS